MIPTIPNDAGPTGNGALFYVMGPSGAGKDTLLNHARSHLAPSAPVVFAHRYITRPANAGGENHVALSHEEFALRERHGCFCMTWDSHDQRYGVGIEVLAWRERGLSVVVNGSRGWLAEAARRFPEMVPVAITVDIGALRARLERRGRETPGQIEERLSRAAAFDVRHPALVTIDNSGAMETAGAALVQLLAGS